MRRLGVNLHTYTSNRHIVYSSTHYVAWCSKYRRTSHTIRQENRR